MNRECKKIKKAYRFKKIKLIICQLLLLILFLTIWELLAYYNVINTFIFSKPSDIFKLLIKYIKTNEIFKHIKVSVIETILGIVIGSFVGIVIAIILWYFETLQKIGASEISKKTHIAVNKIQNILESNYTARILSLFFFQRSSFNCS